MYRLRNYGQMIDEALRTGAYAEALRRAVRPGAAVLDLGAGAGIFALLACQAGARRVYAIETDAVIQVARDAARANGFADRIQFFQAQSTEVSLPEPVDVLVCDLRGCLPLLQDNLAAIADARRRFLAPGGTLIPQRDVLWLAAVEAEDLHRETLSPWAGRPYGLAFPAALQQAANTWQPARIAPAMLLGPPAELGTLDYRTVEAGGFRGELRLDCARAGTAHGLGLWFDAHLLGDIGFSNAPNQPRVHVYDQSFFPWPEPVPVAAGDQLEAKLRADPVGGQYLWSWDSRVLAGGDPARPKAAFRQSAFHNQPVSPAALRRQAAGHRPELNDYGRIDLEILRGMAEGLPLGAIGERVAAAFPAAFPGPKAALARVGELSLRYSR